MIDTLVSCLFSFFKTVIISLGKNTLKKKLMKLYNIIWLSSELYLHGH